MPGKRGTVLVVDDSEDSAELLSELLEQEGFRAVVGGTAAEGLAAYSRERPVAVLLDWVLPDGPGIEVCRSIRSQDPTVPIIFVSGRDDETSVVRGLDAGADDYLAKPVRGAELIARLEAHLRKGAAFGARSMAPVTPSPGPDRDILGCGWVRLLTLPAMSQKTTCFGTICVHSHYAPLLCS